MNGMSLRSMGGELIRRHPLASFMTGVGVTSAGYAYGQQRFGIGQWMRNGRRSSGRNGLQGRSSGGMM